MATDTLLPFDLQTIESAPESVKESLQKAQAAFGSVPNLYRMMANSPALLLSYLKGYELFRSQTAFSPVEQEVIFLSISYVNECHYCMAAHSVVADMMSKVPAEVTDAIRSGATIPDAKLAALSTFTKIMVEKRGFPSSEEIEAFVGAGYQKEQVLDIVLAIGVKTFSNYANHVANTPVDDAFASRTWEK